ncbi:MAG: OmpP1/FadL family transporter [Acidobacteriota bacterium]
MTRTRVLGGTVALCAGAAGVAFASGYAVYEQGAEAMANAGAFTARADNASALFFNPAGILRLEGIWLDVGTTTILLTGSEFESPSGVGFDQNDTAVYPSTAYYTQKISDRLAWGLAITSPFGLKTKWDEDFEGRFISRESNIAVVNFNPNLAFRLGRDWTGAFGLDYALAQIRELSRNIDSSSLSASDCFTSLDGDGGDIGWNAAVQWAPENGWRWGLSYRAEMEPDVGGDVEFEGIAGAVASLFSDGPASADLPLPATMSTGLAYVSGGKWEGEFDVVWTDWSTFDRLRIDVENESALVTDIDQIEEWDDTLSFRAAFSYHVRPRHEWRAGAYFDQNPVPDDHIRPRLPDADRTSLQVGYGYRGPGRLRLDVAYQAPFFDDRPATGDPGSGIGMAPAGSGPDPVQPGGYGNFTSLVGVSVSWVLEGP